MPRQKSKNKKPASSRNRADISSDDESVFNDNASIISNASTNSYPPNSNDENVEIFENKDDYLRDKLLDYIELAQEKSIQGRIEALNSIRKTFTKLYAPGFVGDRIDTISSVLARALKRGKSKEQAAAANLASCFFFQLQSSENVESVFQDLNPELTSILLDASCSIDARTSSATALGIGCFLSNEQQHFQDVLDKLEKVFKGSLKPSESKNLPDAAVLHTAAVSAWGLVVTLVSRQKTFNLLKSHLPLFSALLETSDVDLRIAAGETIALLYEEAYELDDVDAEVIIEPVMDQLKLLSTDSSRYRSKKDRKEQKSSFRDILAFVEDGSLDFDKVILHEGDILTIDSWASKKRYDAMCQCLMTGMKYHLSENELLREIFDLGAPVLNSEANKLTRKQKNLRLRENQSHVKARDQDREKKRDKKFSVA